MDSRNNDRAEAQTQELQHPAQQNTAPVSPPTTAKAAKDAGEFKNMAQILNTPTDDVAFDAPKKNEEGPGTETSDAVDQLKRERVLLGTDAELGTGVRDPLFAAKILERESAPFPKQERPVEAPTKEPAQETSDEETITRLRTYQGDVAEALKKQKTSVVQMVLAEQGKRDRVQEEKSPTSKKNLPFVLLAGIFSVAGVLALLGGAWYFFYQKEQAPIETPGVSIPSLLFTETKKEISITGRSKDNLINSVASEIKGLDIRLDFIEQVYFTKELPLSTTPTLAETETVKTLVTTEQFFDATGSNIPDSLKRSLSDEFMFGIHVFNGNQPFIILKTDFFENTFAGMLRWEEYMARDLLPLFGAPAESGLLGKKFQDIVLKNRDIRALLNENGELVLIYTFFDRGTIIIATAEETLDEVITRLQRPQTR